MENKLTRRCATAIGIALVMILGISFGNPTAEFTWLGLWVSILGIAVGIYKKHYIPTEEDRV